MGQLDLETERALSDGKRLLADNREGGRHRRAASIGKGSANVKLKTWIKRGGYFGLAVFAIMIAASVIGTIINGIGFVGIMAVAMAIMCAAVFFSQFPKVKIPKREELTKGDPKQMVARTELWLEAQRPALPAPAAKIVEDLGVQLDSLGLQLETVDANHPSVREVRELVGEYIPETIDNYRKVPEHLRGESHAGKTADQRLTDSLGKLSSEVDRVTRRMAEGALDDLAIKDRYLEYRYGGDDLIEDMTGKTG
ncbi:hypothetical protein FGU71_03260 [Erythrobacter insulae]|uniref:Uncharacterized protein n=1 Tax=Erythrobacter insulae TaxID=2584124 RepID=A0A547PA04_9SPHN|nr:hypothetical protein [Erythrobacter insulae]TRD10970.1 hypothetical protein FGU71_03260 [Erythrobacter insulae]